MEGRVTMFSDTDSRMPFFLAEFSHRYCANRTPRSGVCHPAEPALDQ